MLGGGDELGLESKRVEFHAVLLHLLGGYIPRRHAKDDDDQHEEGKVVGVCPTGGEEGSETCPQGRFVK